MLQQIMSRQEQMYKELKDEINQIKNPFSSPLPSKTVINPNSKPILDSGKTVIFQGSSSPGRPSSSQNIQPTKGITLRGGKELEGPSYIPLNDFPLQDDPQSDSDSKN